MRIAQLKLLLINLKGEIKQGCRGYRTPLEALITLKELTGQDFGYDVKKWDEWIKCNKKILNASKETSDIARKLLSQASGLSAKDIEKIVKGNE